MKTSFYYLKGVIFYERHWCLSIFQLAFLISKILASTKSSKLEIVFMYNILVNCVARSIVVEDVTI